MMGDPQKLLEAFVNEGSESAFRELVSRYIDLVYSTAVRLVDGDTHRAQDISQIVFADLARMAWKLPPGTALGGWLHRNTCFVARTTMRGERRRQVRERQAAEMRALNEEDTLAQISPVLDEAIQELGPDDRDAILLRFFERRSLRSVGEALGTNENVAQKRVVRAVQELGLLLRKHGVILSGAALASCLAAGAVKTAPTGLGLGIAATILSSHGTTAGTSLAAAKVAIAAKTKFAVGAAILAVIVTGLVLHNRAPAPARANSDPSQVVMGNPTPVVVEDPPAADEALKPASLNARLSKASPKAAQTEAALITTNSDQLQTTNVIGRGSNQGILTTTGVKLSARSGSWLLLQGKSNTHDWQAMCPLMGGSFELGTEFPLEAKGKVEPGPIQARAEVFVTVRSLRSIENDGNPYSDRMDEIMWESLKSNHYPKIQFRLWDLLLTGSTNYQGLAHYEFKTRGELEVAGVTNDLSMPVTMTALGGGNFKIAGATLLKMSAFGIQPPTLKLALGMVQTADDVNVSFEWLIAARQANLTNGLVPLVLDLPEPAFKTVPHDLLSHSQSLEPLSNFPRPPVLVPSGLVNLAPGALLTCSDNNVTREALARIVDGDKEASEQSIIYLRKGVQWVQMDFGKPQEIFAIVLWHAHNTPKTYHDVVVTAANLPDFKTNVRALFNNDRENACDLGKGNDREYIETYEGKLINTRGLNARYLRFYSKGSTESALNEYTEIEVYGRPTR